MSLNPFKLFNIDYKSSIDELKKSFKSLSLICHPDKGGNKEDMDILYNSYVWVREQIENGDHGRTMEKEEEEFQKFLKEQEQVKAPTLFEIMTDGFNKNFNEEFESQNNYHKMVYEGGYEEKDFKDESEGVMIIYKEPKTFNSLGFDDSFCNLNGKVDDFTGGIGFDYKNAYVKEKIIEQNIDENETFEQRLQRIKEEREQLEERRYRMDIKIGIDETKP